MTLDLASAIAFTTTYARVLDRHRLRLLLDPGDHAATVQVLDALAAYRNADGGYGWGLEPDLRSTESQPGPALHAFEVWVEAGSQRGPETVARRSGAGESGLRHGRFEQFDRIAGRVVDQDLLAADAGNDVVAEVHPVLS
jgi:hypothetical protein